MSFLEKMLYSRFLFPLPHDDLDEFANSNLTVALPKRNATAMSTGTARR